MTLLRLEGVAGVRGGRAVFAGVDLALAAGGAAVVTGPNGAGKTTLLRIAAGLLRPEAGRVVRSGTVAWLGEQPGLDDELVLSAVLGQWARIDGRGDGRAAAAAALAAMGLEDLAGVPVRFLSTGQRRRAAIARVVASAAPLWLLDEPASGLDAAAQGRLAAAIAGHRAVGGAVLAATHQPLDLPGAISVGLG